MLAALPRDPHDLLAGLGTVLGGPAEPPLAGELASFLELMRAYPLRPGKTLRGQLLMLSARAHGADDDGSALVLAEALELFQNWVLVHDDIEDDSEERRGEPALHRQVGMPVALNVGDAMHLLMWRHLHTLPRGTPLQRDEALAEFNEMIFRTAAGQHLDLVWVEQGRFDVSESDYLAMVSLKTAYYTVVSPLRLGAACAGASAAPVFEAAGLELGVAFQIRDDVLNLTPGAVHGKEFAGDLYEGKRTLVLAHLMAHASSAEREMVVSALNRPRANKDPAEIRAVLDLIERYRSLHYAQAEAETRLQRGLRQLEAALAPLERRGDVERLLGLLAGLAARNS